MAFRNLMRHKIFSLINIAGLALGMTCSILILLWVKDELSFDRFHKHQPELYRVMQLQHYPGGDNLTVSATPGPLAEVLEQEFPEVKYAVRSTTWEWKQLFAYHDKSLKVSGRYTDPEFFEVFSFPLLYGDPAQVLRQPNSVVISEKVARQFFDAPEEAMGQMFRIDNSKSYKVTGVMQDVPKNSSMQFDYVMPVDDWIKSPGNEWLKDWGSNALRTFLLLKPGSDIAAFNKKIRPVVQDHHDGYKKELFVQPFGDMYLYDDFRGGEVASGRIENVRLFAVVAVFILVIACINFMNLATARSAKRAKEVGVRKVIGASKPELIRQFLVESMLVSFLALFLSLNLAGMLLPQFNDLTGKFIQLDLTDPSMMALLLGIAVLAGLLSGSYPAFFLSSFKPAVVLKSTVRMGTGGVLLRKGLVVFQFILSALLIISTLVVYMQLHYIRTKNIGMNRENLIYVPMEGELQNRYEVVKRELEDVPGILSVTSANQNPLMIGNSTGDVNWRGKDPDAGILFSVMTVDYDFAETMGVTLKEGRDFSREYGTDTAAFLVNEEAARLMQMQDPVGEWLQWDVEGHIVGVMRNFHSTSMHIPTQPLVLRLRPESENLVFARVAPGKTTEVLTAMEQILKRHNPVFPFEYRFMDQDFEMMYKTEAIMGQLTKYFAGIAIFISCLGLFGLALFTAEQRTKEIGVRKVLGASVSGIVFMLSKDFLKLVFFANLIALPLGWYFMSGWLNDYADRTEMSWWIFVVAFVSTVLIATVTLSFHAIRTALANPVTSLRTE
ncbi:ABC transporter permease [Pontibacter saemangeumensis]|uniref:ABC transporter permease n=2 Tax=Pontibacter saemangeumensis TaxID=1084525 RepID=A0ABP8LMN0_9BACT